jgi:XTP/dITP diphosphohydrolase
MATTLYLATGNQHKAVEFNQLLQNTFLRVAAAADIGGMPEVAETAGTFEGNALLKAQALLSNLPEDAFAMADDSGLIVDCLDGEPGVDSAYYAGPNASYAENREKLLKAMQSVPEDARTARFRCCLVLLSESEGPIFFNGFVEGVITTEDKGELGFGYDSIFRPLGQTETFGQLGSEVKDQISHRAKAVQKMYEWFRLRPA